MGLAVGFPQRLVAEKVTSAACLPKIYFACPLIGWATPISRGSIHFAVRCRRLERGCAAGACTANQVPPPWPPRLMEDWGFALILGCAHWQHASHAALLSIPSAALPYWTGKPPSTSSARARTAAPRLCFCPMNFPVPSSCAAKITPSTGAFLFGHLHLQSTPRGDFSFFFFFSEVERKMRIQADCLAHNSCFVMG